MRAILLHFSLMPFRRRAFTLPPLAPIVAISERRAPLLLSFRLVYTDAAAPKLMPFLAARFDIFAPRRELNVMPSMELHAGKLFSLILFPAIWRDKTHMIFLSPLEYIRHQAMPAIRVYPCFTAAMIGGFAL